MKLDRIPLFVRGGAVIAEGPAVQHTGELTQANRIEKLRVFGIPDARALDHEKDLDITCDNDTLTLSFSAEIICETFDVQCRLAEGLLEIMTNNRQAPL
jgi:alpha-glucosidase (family GH31 glycosyl hydrolase)